MTTDTKTAVEQSSLSGLADLSENDIISSLFEDTIKDKKEEKEIVADIPEDIIIPEEIKKEEKIIEKVVDKKEEIKSDEIIIPGEKLDDVKKTDELSIDTSSWIPLAKDLGFEIKVNDFNEFKTGLEAEKIKIRETAIADYQKEKKEEIISKFPVDAQLMILGLENGLTIEKINKPFAEIDNLMALSDTDLVAKDLELEGMTPEMVEKEVLRMGEEGKLDVEAFRIRKFLETSKIELKEKSIVDLNAIKQKNEERNKQLLEKDTTEIYNSLKAIPKLMESEIKEKHVNYVIEKWKKGEYQELFKNPNTVAQFLLQHEFGSQASSMLAKKKFEEGRNGIVNKLHNIPPKQNGNIGQINTTISREESIGNFGFLENVSIDDL